MIGPIICAAARAAAPTLARLFVREAVRAAAVAAGGAVVYGVSRVVRDRYDRRQQKACPQIQNARWN